MIKIAKSETIKYSRPGMSGNYYQLPDLNSGTTFAVATFTGEHGERIIGEKERMYMILQGKAKFMVNDVEFEAGEEDLIIIPKGGKYNFWPTSEQVKVLVVMELLDISKLPK